VAIGDSALLYGQETTYGTAATLTKAYEALSDPWKLRQEYMETRGFRAGIQAMSSARTFPVKQGAEGSIAVDVQNKAMGLLLRDMFVTTTGPTQQGGTTAWQSTHATGAGGPTTSATIQMIRADVGGTTTPFTHLGCMCTGWELSQEVNGKLNVTASYDAQDVTTATAAGTPAYASGADLTTFHWGHCSVTVNAVAVDQRRIQLSADYKQATDRRFLRASYLKKKPTSNELPAYSGELEGEFESTTHYDRFVSGAVVPAVFKWEGATISGAHKFTFQVDLPAIQYRGESPEVALNELPKQTIPFVVLWDGASPAITVTYKTTDVAF
jgi:hypothetical protein